MNQIPTRDCPLEESIRRSPIALVAAAFLTGILFRILPVAAIASLLIRLAAALIRPVLLVFGIAKAVELIRKRNR
jgi:hypothetical protein